MSWRRFAMLDARLLAKAGPTDRARSELDTGIANFHDAPAFERKRERADLREAQRMLDAL